MNEEREAELVALIDKAIQKKKAELVPSLEARIAALEADRARFLDKLARVCALTWDTDTRDPKTISKARGLMIAGIVSETEIVDHAERNYLSGSTDRSGYRQPDFEALRDA